MKTTKIFDCSNSSYRPTHRVESYGPKENDIIRWLKTYARRYGCEFVDKVEKCDVILTNDVYPAEVIKDGRHIPKVKRMDGVFWRKDEVERNVRLNAAAVRSNCVVFISRYSQRSLYNLYGLKPSWSQVILNTANPSIFMRYPSREDFQEVPNTFVAVATNWARQEKRFKDVIHFADAFRDIDITLIGHVDEDVTLPENVTDVGYIGRYSAINDMFNTVDAFLNLSYRDPAPKVVAQAIAARLPVLYADSGGTHELVGSRGVGIEDPVADYFEDEVPELDHGQMLRAFNEFRANYGKIVNSWYEDSFWTMLKRYFDIIKNVKP